MGVACCQSQYTWAAAARDLDIGAAAVVMTAVAAGYGSGVRLCGCHQFVRRDQHVARVHTHSRPDAGHLYIVDIDQQLEPLTGGHARVECDHLEPE